MNSVGVKFKNEHMGVCDLMDEVMADNMDYRGIVGPFRSTRVLPSEVRKQKCRLEIVRLLKRKISTTNRNLRTSPGFSTRKPN